MKTILRAGLIIVATLILAGVAIAAEISEPVYKNGESWTFQVGGTSGVIENGKYVVRREKGSFHMYWINAQGKEESLESDYQEIMFRITPFVARNDKYKWLKFPLRGQYTSKYSYEFEPPRSIRVDATAVVKDTKTIQFKGESVEVVELEREEVMGFGTKETKYTYCPRTKSVMSASSVRIGGRADGMIHTVKLVDYNVK